MKTRSEKLLFAILLGIVFLAANVFLFKRVSDKKRSLEILEDQFDREMLLIQDNLEIRDEMFRYRDWMDENQPAYGEGEEADKSIIALVRSAGDYDVAITSQNLLEPEVLPHVVQTAVAIRCNAELKSLMKWVYHLQKPGQFRVIRKFKLTPEKEDKNRVDGEFVLMIWHRVDS